MDRRQTEDYYVLSLRGYSQSGGDPDVTANKIITRWGKLRASSEDAQLSLKAIPMEGFEQKLKLILWMEGEGKRGSFVLSENQREVCFDRGEITEIMASGDSGEFQITMKGIYLLELVFICKPIGVPGPVVGSLIGKTQSSPPLDMDTDTEDTPEILASVDQDKVQPEQQVQKQKAKNTTRKGKINVKAKETDKIVMDLAFASVCEAFEVIEGSFTPDAKKAAAFVLKDKLDLGGTVIASRLTPGKNTGGIYALAIAARKLMEKDGDFKKKVARIIREVKEKMDADGGLQEVPRSSATVRTSLAPGPGRKNGVRQAVETDEEPLGVREMSLFFLFQIGIPAKRIMTAFDLDSRDALYRAVGHVNMQLGPVEAGVLSASIQEAMSK